MSQQPRFAGWTWLATAAIAGSFALSTAACAPAAYSSRGQSLYSPTPYDRLQQRSQQLEMLAARARDGARLDQRRGGRKEVTDRIDDFTKHAHDLRQLVRDRGVPASKINDRIRQLMDDGNKVQKEWAKSRTRNPRTLADWDRAQEALTDLNGQFMAASGVAVRPEVGVGTSGSFPDRPYDRTGRDVEATSGFGTRDRYAVVDMMQLSQELNRRVMRASELAADENLNDVSNKIAEFRDRFRDFDTRAGRMDRDERRDRLDNLLKDAQATQRDLARRRAAGDLVDQWNGVVDLVVRLRDAS